MERGGNSLAVMIARALKLPLDNSALTGFADDNEIPLRAKGAVRHLHDMQIVSGKGDMRFSLSDRATRAEAVSLLLRMLEHAAGK